MSLLTPWLLLVGCGGIVESGPHESSSESSSAAQAGARGSSSQPAGDTELGECVLGPAESYDVPCAWVAAGRCYEQREMACNCSCPRSHDSQCVSSFDSGPQGHVPVTCN